MSELEVVRLTVDELEALRLADLLGKYHEQAAGEMNVSRQTFGRILASARKKTADALVNGKALSVEGGVVEQAGSRTFECSACGYRWSVPRGTGNPKACPSCGSPGVFHAAGGVGKGRRGRGCGRGGGKWSKQ